MAAFRKIETSIPFASHLPPALRSVRAARRDSAAARAFSLSLDELRAARHALHGVSEPQAQIERAIAWLGVETSPRHAPAGDDTFCNVYSHDFCLLVGVYLPRVWWTQTAFDRASFDIVQVGTSASELTANDLFQWLAEHGVEFGWREVPDADAAQRAANDGKLVLACAFEERPDKHGHMTFILADRDAQTGNDGERRYLQSQAGKENCAAAWTKPWWDNFRLHAFWVATPDAPPARQITTARSRLARHPLAMIATVAMPSAVRQLDANMARLVRGDMTPISVSPQFLRALVAAEDRGGNWHGARTIERRFVRTLLAPRSKVTEIVLAATLSRRFSRHRIAEAYIASAHYGWRMNGLDEACHRLGIDVTACSAEEACDVIAALKYALPEQPTPAEVEVWKRWSREIMERLGPVWVSY